MASLPDTAVAQANGTAPTHVALLTPPGRGAVASLRVRGPAAVAMVERLFVPHAAIQLGALPPGRIVVGQWGCGGEEVVVAHLSANLVELHCHGGAAAWRAIHDDLVTAGCIAQSWQEAVRGDIADPIAAAAWELLPHAATQRTAAILLDQAEGALRSEVERIAHLLEQRDLPSAAKGLHELLRRAPLGRRLVDPWQVVVTGPPNVGKSSLVNALLGYPRAIVCNEPGTTRDIVTALTVLDGWPVELADTAGLRATADTVESTGVGLARQRAESADLVILVFDATAIWTAEEQSLREDWPTAVVVCNKCDLPPASATGRPAGLNVSAVTGDGLEQLQRAIVQRLVPTIPAPGTAVPFTAEHLSVLQAVLAATEHGDTATALTELARML